MFQKQCLRYMTWCVSMLDLFNFYVKRVSLWMKYICVEWVFANQNKKELWRLCYLKSQFEIVLYTWIPFESNLWNYVVVKRVPIVMLWTSVHPFFDCWLWLLEYYVSLTLLCVTYVIIVECLWGNKLWNDSCAMQFLNAKWTTLKWNTSSGILETECWISILKQ